jgi:hypothetical protein
MRRKPRYPVLLTTITIAVLSISQYIVSANQTSRAGIGRIVREHERFNELIPLDAEIELVASGFEWSEGPVWIHDGEGGYLLFSDIPRNSVMKWQEGQGISLFMKPSGYTGVTDYGREPGSNGLTLDLQDRIIFCEHGDRRISRLEAIKASASTAQTTPLSNRTVISISQTHLMDCPSTLKTQDESSISAACFAFRRPEN